MLKNAYGTALVVVDGLKNPMWGLDIWKDRSSRDTTVNVLYNFSIKFYSIGGGGGIFKLKYTMIMCWTTFLELFLIWNHKRFQREALSSLKECVLYKLQFFDKMNNYSKMITTIQIIYVVVRKIEKLFVR